MLSIVPVCVAARTRLARLSAIQFSALSVTAALVLSLLMFSPKLWLLRQPLPGTFEWTRAQGFLDQCREPLSRAVEPALRWRLLPPLVAHGLGLSGIGALLLPWVGLLCLLGYWTAVAERWLGDRLDALLLAVLLGTTGGVLTITNWLGINDAWFILGLVAVAGGKSWPSLIWSGLLAPWVDERFLLGWPLALFCRWWLQGRPGNFMRTAIVAGIALVPYVGLRLGLTFWRGDTTSHNFLQDAFATLPIYLPYVQLGWWMGLRAGWVLLFFAAWTWWREGVRDIFLIGVGVTGVGLLAATVLAADITRSTALLTPLLLAGAVALRRSGFTAETVTALLGGSALVNLLAPAALIIGDKTSLLWNLPLELLRLYKN